MNSSLRPNEIVDAIGEINIENNLNNETFAKLKQELRERSLAKPIVRGLVSNREFIKGIARDTNLLGSLARDEALSNRISIRIHQFILKNAFMHDLANEMLQKQGRQFTNFVKQKCNDFLERKRILTRLNRMEEKVETLNRELQGLVNVVRELIPTR